MTKEEKKQVVDFCKSYLPACKKLRQAQKDKAMLEKRLESPITDYNRFIVEDTIKLVDAQIGKLTIATSRLEYAISTLSGREKSILTQLYIEGKQWREVLNEEGNPMNISRISAIRNRALEKIAAYILPSLTLCPENCEG